MGQPKFELIFYVAFFAGCFLDGAEAEHFRGGYMSYVPTGRPREIKLFFRLAYKHNFFLENDQDGGEDCSHAAIEDRTLVSIGARGDFSISYTNNAQTASVDPFNDAVVNYTCTNIREHGPPELQWSSGFNETVIELPQSDTPKWDVGYDSCCWLRDLVNYGSPRSWQMRIAVNLEEREDLDGRPNSSPYVEGLPLKSVAQQCVTVIPINALDQDGDKVRCRWTQESPRDGVSECENNCGNPNNTIFSWMKKPCKIRVNATNAEPGLYAVAVIIEDFPKNSRKGRRIQSYSKIPYQFLVSIERRDVDCNRVITEVPDERCYAVPLVITPPFTFTLRAQTNDPTIPITSIDMITRPGMTVSPLVEDGNGRYHVNVEFIPLSSQQPGTVEQLCYQAVDSEGIVGEELCVQLFLGGTAPEPIPSLPVSNSDNSELVPIDNEDWILYFTQEVMLSEDTVHGVDFLYENRTVAYSTLINKSNIIEIGHNATVGLYFVTFTTSNFNLTSDTNYTIKLMRGVVLGAAGCHLPSEPDEWQFTTVKIERGLLPPEGINFNPELVGVHCSPTFMVAYIERNLLPNIDPSILTLNDPDCYGIVHNESHFAIGSMYGKCGTEAIVNDDQSRVSMINNVVFPMEGNFVYGNVTTRSEVVRLRVNCSIPTRRVAYVEFNTNTSVETYQANSTGDYKFSLKLFPDESYRRPYRVWNFPVDVQQNARMYFEARTYQANMAPYLEECVATPTADPAHESLRYTLIRDGCPLDPTLMWEDTEQSSRVRFSVEAFSFIGYNLQSSIFVHCELRNCNPRNGSCDTNCPDVNEEPNRAKRDISSLRQETGDGLTDGPIRITRNLGAGSSISMAETILICLVSVVLGMMLLLSCLVAMAMKNARRHSICTNCSQKSKASKLALVSKGMTTSNI